MPRRTYKPNQRSSSEEQVVSHTPKKEEPSWAYTIKEGGQVYPVKLPTTPEQIEKVKKEILNPKNWGRYHVNPYGGDRNYTQLICFPPFTPIRVAEVFFPDGTVWTSRTRKFTTITKNSK